jgi:two-component system NarL family response regulator
MKLRVMLADDHALFREALRLVLESDPDIEVVAETDNGHLVLACLDQVQADIVCMDVNMPGLNGVETTRALLQRQPGVKVIGLSADPDLFRVAEMCGAGASGYIYKADAGAELLTALRTVGQNRHFFSAALGVNSIDDLKSLSI